MLNCGHNVCSNCCQHLFRQNKLICPICKHENSYEKFTDITLNIFIRQLLEVYSKQDQPEVRITNNPFKELSASVKKAIEKIQQDSKEIETAFAELEAKVNAEKTRILD